MQWPDLAANRRPSNEIHVASQHVAIQGETSKITPSILFLSIARVVAAYCSVSDLLLAIECPEVEPVHVLRINWDETKTWKEAIDQLDTLLARSSADLIPLPVVREQLSIEDPCLALCTIDLKPSPTPPDFLNHFSYNTSTGTLTLISRVSLLHPTVAEQVVEQVAELASNAAHHSQMSLHTVPHFPHHLLSIYDRLPEDSISAAYPHIPPVSFAPDYLDIRANDMPHSIAVSWYSDLSFEQPLVPKSITYLELHRKANQVAHWLLSRGLRKEDRVAVCLDRNLDFHAAMMGIMRAGGCYVPVGLHSCTCPFFVRPLTIPQIDPELPLERKTYIARDAEVALVLTSSQAVTPSVFGTKAIFLEDGDVQSGIAQQPTTPVDGVMDLDALSYMLYTSGIPQYSLKVGCSLTEDCRRHHRKSERVLVDPPRLSTGYFGAEQYRSGCLDGKHS